MCHYAEIVLHVCLVRAECYASSRLEQYSYLIHFLCIFYTLSVLPFGPGYHPCTSTNMLFTKVQFYSREGSMKLNLE